MHELLNRLQGVRKQGDGWQAKCPAHDDNRASLSVGRGDDGGKLLHCHAGCPTEAVVSAIGLTMQDLMPSDNGNSRANAKPREVAAYDYRDEAGDLLFQAVRMEPKDFRQRRPKEGGGWAWSVKGVRVVPYRLPELTKADPTETVFIPEGEKDCDRLAGLGLVATCNAGGAGKWKPEHSEHLHGRRVVILPDADKPGRKHAESVAGSLQGVAESVKVLELPGLPDKGDVSDWLDANGTAEKLRELADAAGEWEPQPAPEPAVVHSDTFPLTDTGLAERFVQQHACSARYCYPWKRWLAWDGCRWNPDCTGIVEQHAKHTGRSILCEAAGESDGDRCKELTGFALRAESAVRRSAMLRLAQSEPGIPVLPDALDTDPWLLTVINGTLELRTGELREHRRADLITKLAPVEYHADAGCPIWLQFMADTFCGNSNLVGFVQRLLGYCLTGIVTEQVLPILYGTGSNGKSTAVNIVLEMLGTDYSMKAPPDMLMLKRDSHPTERADLHGKRLVACVETEENRRLAESLTKELTGGDRIRARKMRQDFWEFTPTHKILLACNHKPVIKGTDHAIWRRVKLVPFTVTIDEAEQDRELPDKLRAELSGILAWTLRGCLDWQQHGLGTPNEVTEATDEYRTEQDTIGEFVAACCETGSCYRTKAGDLFDAYVEWSGDKRMGKRNFGIALRERGLTDTRGTRGVRYWDGIGLAEGGEK